MNDSSDASARATLFRRPGDAAQCSPPTGLVAVLLPQSQNFVATAPRLRRLLEQTVRVLKDPALLAPYGIAVTSMGALSRSTTQPAFGWQLRRTDCGRGWPG
jgi:hypothetical protein